MKSITFKILPKSPFKTIFFVFSSRATTIQYFDEATSSYISLGPSEKVEEVNSDESSSETSAEQNISKLSNDKVKQVCNASL